MINNCQAGHINHDRKTVDTSVGKMLIYDWKQYMGFKGYCMGQDDISKTLENTGVWDAAIDTRIKQILEAGDKRNVVLDVGAHIGYFSRRAVDMGYRVFAYEGDAENFELLKINVPEAKAHFVWFDSNTQSMSVIIPGRIELIKIDLEGSERYAIQSLTHVLNMTNNIIIEVSPTFNDTYPALIENLVSEGFNVFELDGTPFDFNYDFQQKDLWLTK